jgi:hypothetical protein
MHLWHFPDFCKKRSKPTRCVCHDHPRRRFPVFEQCRNPRKLCDENILRGRGWSRARLD